MQRSFKVALFLFMMLPIAVLGQNYINNPYTRFAIGDLINSGTAYNKSLGGSSLALRPNNQINFLNPASYTSQDTLSFLFQAGMGGTITTMTTDLENSESKNFNLNYFAMGFPITRWMNFSLGLVPYSRTQYSIRENLDEIDDMVVNHTGFGGYNDFYFGTAVQIQDFASIGINASYLFGSIERERISDDPDATVAGTLVNEKYVANDFHFRFGMQLHPTFTDKKGKSHRIILGATYDLQSDLNFKYSSLTSRIFPSRPPNAVTDSFNVISDSAVAFNLPMQFGIGMSYTYNNRLTLNMEYSKQKFSEGLGIRTYTDLTDYSSIRFGAEYTPIPLTERKRAHYLQRMSYRAGFHKTNSYLSLNGEQIQDIGFSIGLGLPWRNSQKLYTHTAFNISYEFGKLGTTDKGLIQENYHIISVGIKLHDFWFMKPKYD